MSGGNPQGVDEEDRRQRKADADKHEAQRAAREAKKKKEREARALAEKKKSRPFDDISPAGTTSSDTPEGNSGIRKKRDPKKRRTDNVPVKVRDGDEPMTDAEDSVDEGSVSEMEDNPMDPEINDFKESDDEQASGSGGNKLTTSGGFIDHSKDPWNPHVAESRIERIQLNPPLQFLPPGIVRPSELVVPPIDWTSTSTNPADEAKLNWNVLKLKLLNKYALRRQYEVAIELAKTDKPAASAMVTKAVQDATDTEEALEAARLERPVVVDTASQRDFFTTIGPSIVAVLSGEAAFVDAQGMEAFLWVRYHDKLGAAMEAALKQDGEDSRKDSQDRLVLGNYMEAIKDNGGLLHSVELHKNRDLQVDNEGRTVYKPDDIRAYVQSKLAVLEKASVKEKYMIKVPLIEQWRSAEWATAEPLRITCQANGNSLQMLANVGTPLAEIEKACATFHTSFRSCFARFRLLAIGRAATAAVWSTLKQMEKYWPEVFGIQQAKARVVSLKPQIQALKDTWRPKFPKKRFSGSMLTEINTSMKLLEDERAPAMTDDFLNRKLDEQNKEIATAAADLGKLLSPPQPPPPAPIPSPSPAVQPAQVPAAPSSSPQVPTPVPASNPPPAQGTVPQSVQPVVVPPVQPPAPPAQPAVVPQPAQPASVPPPVVGPVPQSAAPLAKFDQYYAQLMDHTHFAFELEVVNTESRLLQRVTHEGDMAIQEMFNAVLYAEDNLSRAAHEIKLLPTKPLVPEEYTAYVDSDVVNELLGKIEDARKRMEKRRREWYKELNDAIEKAQKEIQDWRPNFGPALTEIMVKEKEHIRRLVGDVGEDKLYLTMSKHFKEILATQLKLVTEGEEAIPTRLMVFIKEQKVKVKDLEDRGKKDYDKLIQTAKILATQLVAAQKKEDSKRKDARDEEERKRKEKRDADEQARKDRIRQEDTDRRERIKKDAEALKERYRKEDEAARLARENRKKERDDLLREEKLEKERLAREAAEQKTKDAAQAKLDKEGRDRDAAEKKAKEARDKEDRARADRAATAKANEDAKAREIAYRERKDAQARADRLAEQKAKEAGKAPAGYQPRPLSPPPLPPPPPVEEDAPPKK
jgi:hypothetical protein